MTGFYMKCNTGLKWVSDITNPCANRKLMSLMYHQMNNLPKGLSNRSLKALYLYQKRSFFLGLSKIYQKKKQKKKKILVRLIRWMKVAIKEALSFHQIELNENNFNVIRQLIYLIFYLGFLSQIFTNHRTAGEGGEHFLTPHYHFYPLHRKLGISRAITEESSPLHIASSRTRVGNLWCPSASRYAQ